MTANKNNAAVRTAQTVELVRIDLRAETVALSPTQSCYFAYIYIMFSFEVNRKASSNA